MRTTLLLLVVVVVTRVWERHCDGNTYFGTMEFTTTTLASSAEPVSSSMSASPWAQRAVDLLKALPAVVWLGVCIAAIPSYASIAWKMPIVCAILSSCVSIAATYDIVRFQRRYKYLLFGDPTALGRSRWAEVKLAVGCLVAAVCLGLCIAFLTVGYSIPRPAEAKDGCGYGNFRSQVRGVCGTCAADSRGTGAQLCLTNIPAGCNATCAEIRDAYVAAVGATHPQAAGFCPPPPHTVNTFVSFSCLADGYWMLVTSVVSLIWVVSLCALRRRSASDLIAIGPSLAPLFRKNVASYQMRPGRASSST